MFLDMFLYLVQIFAGVSIPKVILLWICDSVVMLCMYNLTLRYCWDLVSMCATRLKYVGMDCHSFSKRVPFMGNEQFVVVM